MGYIVKYAEKDLGIMKKQFSPKYLDYNTINITVMFASKTNRLSTGYYQRKIQSNLGYTVKIVAKDIGSMREPC